MKIPFSYRKPFAMAVGLHVLLLLILLFQLPHWSYQYHSSGDQPQIVNASVVAAPPASESVSAPAPQKFQPVTPAATQSTVVRVQERQKTAAHHAPMKALAHAQAVKAAQAAAAAMRAKAVLAREKAQAQKIAAAKMAAEKALVEKKALAQKAQAEKALAAKMAAEKALAEKKALAQKEQAEKVLAAKKAAAAHQAALAKALALKQRQAKKQAALLAAEARLQQQLLSQQLAGDKTRVQEQIQTTQLQGIVDKYKALIISAIGEQWLVPDGTDKNLSCIYEIQLAPGGVVLSVTLVKSSGNATLDQSAQTAIYKASPLPVPKDPAAFDNFRDLRLTVSPKQVVQS